MAKRRNIPNSLKSEIIRAYLKGKSTVSELAREHDLQPTQIYMWEKQLFENSERVFERKNCRVSGQGAVSKLNTRVETLEAKLAKKDEVISVLTQELIQEKKFAGVWREESM